VFQRYDLQGKKKKIKSLGVRRPQQPSSVNDAPGSEGQLMEWNSVAGNVTCLNTIALHYTARAV